MLSFLGKAIQRFNDWENKRYELLEKSGRRFGASVVNDRVRFGNQKEGGPVSQVAFIAMSVDNPTKNNTQFGGYAAVWLDRNRGNIYGSHNGPCTGALVFPLLALIEVLKNCPRDQPLIIACNNSMITNYVVGKTPAVSNKNHHLERYLDQINHYLGIRTAPTNSYLFCSNTRAEYVKKFYDLAQDIAREARKQRSRGSEESRSSATPELNQRDESSQEITRTVADISIIMKRLKDIEASREVILKELREPVEAYSNGREEVAVIAMSADSPRPPKDKQLGGYGVVWLNNSIENQFGNYDGKSEQSLNFLIMAATDAILQCPSDRRLVIACKNQLIVNFLNDKHPSLSKKNRELGPYIEIIERTLQTRTEPIRAILVSI
ncbi:hypothetical protein BDA99DRAFT_124808 [Phascolomyces articulosus]|uniref:Uncharacterized protein n=1 Tax=Phascolomyces articulosus TaxID=60185 RepID=A0AAD5KBE6_9FUNG|nr:hypothetical protein BDA99DRAFT_124808 [Phascolomyces articulosus]